MTGYSGKPLVEKLGIKPEHRVVLLGAPAGYPAGLGALPARVTLSQRLGAADVAILFTRASADLAKRFVPVAERLRPGGMFWVAWPKRASGERTDLTEDVVRGIGLAAGLVDVKVCAIDDTWSGLKFLRRRASAQVAGAAARGGG